jgi:mono/diheme cytochrome c family protein
MKTVYSLVCGALLLPASQAMAENELGNAENGQKLHAEKCSRCHGTEVYTRENRNVTSLESLKQQANGCNSMTGASLFPEEVRDIVHYLNSSFYKFER